MICGLNQILCYILKSPVSSHTLLIILSTIYVCLHLSTSIYICLHLLRRDCVWEPAVCMSICLVFTPKMECASEASVATQDQDLVSHSLIHGCKSETEYNLLSFCIVLVIFNQCTLHWIQCRTFGTEASPSLKQAQIDFIILSSG